MKLHIDFETYSPASIDAGDYFLHPDFAVTVIAWAFGNGPVKSVVWPFTQTLPEGIRAHILQGGIVAAHNATFEHNVIVQHFKMALPVEQLDCTMERAYAWGLTGSLGAAGRALGLLITKDASGETNMKAMGKKPIHETDPVRLANLENYCRQDVEAERALDQALPALTTTERKVSLLSRRSNLKGFLVDTHAAQTLKTVADAALVGLDAELCALTGGAVTAATQLPSLKEWLETRGLIAPSITKETVPAMLAGMLPPDVRRALEIRALAGKSSLAKLPAMLTVVGPDRRARHQFQYYGAARTGRWAGRDIQPQNMPRPHAKGFDAAGALEAIVQDSTILPILFSNPLEVVSSCLRPCIVAKPGHVLMSLDLSQIEARVTAWLAGQHDLTARFANNEPVYELTAAGVGSSDRQLGKVLVLACQYGMGWKKFQKTARDIYDVHLTAYEAEAALMLWREQNRRICEFWWDMDRAALAAIGVRKNNWGDQFKGSFGGITYAGENDIIAFKKVGRTLAMRKPNGDKLFYHNPRGILGVKDWEFHFDSVSKAGVRDSGIWGGTFVENMAQATARDIMADAIVRIYDRYAYVPVMTVHDEAVYEIADDLAVQAAIRAAFEEVPSWASGLPIASDTKSGRRYTK